jgi:hypothetical protein
MKQIFPRNGALLEFKDVIPTSVIRSIIGFKFKSSPWQIVGVHCYGCQIFNSKIKSQIFGFEKKNLI